MCNRTQLPSSPAAQGMWAERALPHLNPSELADFEVVLGLENPDLFKWLTGQLDAPAEMLDNKAYRVRGLFAMSAGD